MAGTVNAQAVSYGSRQISMDVLLANTPTTWAHLTFTGGVPTLNKSINVSSTTDTAVGRTNTQLTNSYTDGNYAHNGGGQGTADGEPCFVSQHSGLSSFTGQFQWCTIDDNNTFRDMPRASFELRGDLA